MVSPVLGIHGETIPGRPLCFRLRKPRVCPPVPWNAPHGAARRGTCDGGTLSKPTSIRKRLTCSIQFKKKPRWREKDPWQGHIGFSARLSFQQSRYMAVMQWETFGGKMDSKWQTVMLELTKFSVASISGGKTYKSPACQLFEYKRIALFAVKLPFYEQAVAFKWVSSPKSQKVAYRWRLLIVGVAYKYFYLRYLFLFWFIWIYILIHTYLYLYELDT